MKNVLIIGAGRSATACINYCLTKAGEDGWFVTVADSSPELAEKRVNNHPNGRAAWLDVSKKNDRADLIGRHDIVVSLLPAHLHLLVATDCIRLKKHLITASYVSKEMYRLGDEARDASLIFMGEMGLDPGIDHMSAMKLLNSIRAKGGKISSFKSYTGGLIAPESDDNPWHYKFTWNPRNVVLAGQGTAQYLKGGKYKYTPYSRLFKEYHTIDVPGMGKYDAYVNRDSLLYREIYGVEGIPNLIRGTLRYPGFCDAWHALVKIGLTDGSYPIHDAGKITYHEWMNAYLPVGTGSVKERMARFLGEEIDSPVMLKLDWLGLFRKKKINLASATPALILEHLLLDKWKLSDEDKDMIIMQHEIEYELDGKKKHVTSSMVMKGVDSEDTAMARFVGLPLGIFVKLIVEGKITTAGVNIPVMQEFYDPVLEELEEYGVVFNETEVDM
ncbi:MAG: saccharopine dehydrogenase-like NADP-dependent oxidoreductase [Maribacter sp.]|jgi:saccharopine dehydrogenase-like NADP-dependent oxidoreductase